jgi:RNA polymerase sporulation-specific sigma factor
LFIRNYEKQEELVIKAKAGEEAAFEELFKSFKPYILKQARAIYVNGYELDDLIQVGIISVFKAINSYDITKGNFTSYVTFAIKNNLNDLIRINGKHRFNTSLEDFTEEEISTKSEILKQDLVEDKYILKEQKRELLEVINTLKEEQRHLIYFLYIDDLGNLKDYAEKYGKNYSCVAKRKAKACKNIKKVLEKYNRDLESNEN